MTTAILEHVNISVSNAKATAELLANIFQWHIRWEGPSMDDGYTAHLGTEGHYIALYSQSKMADALQSTYQTKNGLNHIGVVVDDLDPVRKRVIASGLRLGDHYDYEPGERFYFYDTDDIEYEVVCYQ